VVLVALVAAASGQDRQKARALKDGAATTDAGQGGKTEQVSGEGSKKPDKKVARGRNTPAAQPVLTPEQEQEQEAAALRFVREHHQELAGLLENLKTSNHKEHQTEYRQAIRELFRTSEKIAQTKLVDEERYNIELESWKTESEIRLLAAKLTMGDRQDLRGKLRQQFVRKNQLQLQRLELEKRRIEARIDKLKGNLDQVSQRQLDDLLRSVRKEKPPRKSRPAAVGSPDKGAREKSTTKSTQVTDN
jgi:hypothetical protein